MTTPTTDAATPGRDVIHDLGYRHYTGPRLGRRHIWRAIAVESGLGAFGFGRSARTKVVPLLCLVALSVPALIIGVVAAVTGAPQLEVQYSSYVVNLQPLVAVFVAAQAPAVLSRDLRFGVVALYFSRPMRRTDYVSAKYAAFATAVLALLATPLTVLLAGAALAELPLSEQLPDYLRGLAQAVLLALVLAGIGLVIAAVTPRRGTGVAAVLAVLLVLAGVQAFVQELALEEGSRELAGWSQLLSPFTLVDTVGDTVLGAGGPDVVRPPGTLGAVAAVAVTLAVVALCWAVLVRRYRKVSVS